MSAPNEEITESLDVQFESKLVGKIFVDRDRQMSFQYARPWLDDSSSFPVSLSLPMTAEVYSASAAHNFFANLLPEATVRERVCAKLKISKGNDFELLKAIGGDCAGALTIVGGDGDGPALDTSPMSITEELLEQWSSGTSDAFSTVLGMSQNRLSLAGAQDKLPVRIEDSQYLLPGGNLASTHLLKFTSPWFSHLPENEAFTTILARELGLDVVQVNLLPTTSSRILVVERYDRYQNNDQWLRSHQEDCCQALGISHLQKYEKEGGPSFKQCADLLREHSSLPALEIDKLLQWALFNLLAGNSDAHGKNLSILYGKDGTISLAPFYDLVCTRNYERLDRHLAMSIGGEADPGLVGGDHVTRFAADLQVNPSLIFETLDNMLKAIPQALETATEEFNAEWGDSPILERLPIVIRQQCRRTLTLLDN